MNMKELRQKISNVNDDMRVIVSDGKGGYFDTHTVVTLALAKNRKGKLCIPKDFTDCIPCIVITGMLPVVGEQL